MIVMDILKELYVMKIREGTILNWKVVLPRCVYAQKPLLEDSINSEPWGVSPVYWAQVFPISIRSHMFEYDNVIGESHV